jgi:hypothetical protein
MEASFMIRKGAEFLDWATLLTWQEAGKFFPRHAHAGHRIFRDAFSFRVAKENQHSVSNELIQSALSC